MNTLVITRVAERQWHALDDDLVVGRGDASPRPDGRLFLSVDAWHDSVFDLRDGSVVHGPATYPEPAFDARLNGGKVEVRLRENATEHA